jgi:hypothetical protein
MAGMPFGFVAQHQQLPNMGFKTTRGSKHRTELNRGHGNREALRGWGSRRPGNIDPGQHSPRDSMRIEANAAAPRDAALTPP